MAWQRNVPSGAFGIVLAEMCDSRRMSQAELARCAGVHMSYVSRLITGTRKPSRDIVLRIAVGLGASQLQRESLLRAAGYSLDATMSAVLQDVIAERSRQDARWGVQYLSFPEWLLVLTEEVGEAAQAANAVHWHDRETDHLRAELVQVAAVACQIIEAIDRDAQIGQPCDESEAAA